MSYVKIDGVIEVPVKGKTIFIASQVRNYVKSEYQAWMTGRPRRRVFDMRKRGELDAEEFKMSLRSIDEGDATGTFDWGGPAWDESLKKWPGLIKLTVLLARDVSDKKPEQKDFSESDVLAIIDDPDSMQMLGGAVNEAMRATPNFMCPPLTGPSP